MDTPTIPEEDTYTLAEPTFPVEAVEIPEEDFSFVCPHLPEESTVAVLTENDVREAKREILAVHDGSIRVTAKHERNRSCEDFLWIRSRDCVELTGPLLKQQNSLNEKEKLMAGLYKVQSTSDKIEELEQCLSSLNLDPEKENSGRERNGVQESKSDTKPEKSKALVAPHVPMLHSVSASQLRKIQATPTKFLKDSRLCKSVSGFCVCTTDHTQKKQEKLLDSSRRHSISSRYRQSLASHTKRRSTGTCISLPPSSSRQMENEDSQQYSTSCGRSSTESNLSIRPRGSTCCYDIRRYSSLNNTNRSSSRSEKSLRGGKIDRVARFAELQKIWKKDSFVRGIDGEKRPQILQHLFAPLRAST